MFGKRNDVMAREDAIVSVHLYVKLWRFIALKLSKEDT